MSNKNSLQTNNNKLINIKKVIEDLPIIDNIDTGLYIWEKSMIIKSPVTITADNSPNQDGITIKIKVRTSDISLSDLTKADFVGVTIARSGVGYPKIEFISETECITTGSSGAQPYTEEWSWNGNNSSDVNILVYGGSTVAWFEEKFNLDITGFNKTFDKQQFIGYIVSDDEEAYPDDGIQEEYHYKKIEFSIKSILNITKSAKDTFTFASDTYLNNATLTHSLGAIPKLVIVKDEKSQVVASGRYTYIAEIFGYANNALYKNGGGNYETQSFSNYYDVTASNIRFNIASSTRSYCAGVEYTMYTFA